MEATRHPSVHECSPPVPTSGGPFAALTGPRLAALGLVLLAAVTFAPLAGTRYAFINADDKDYVTDNPHVRGGLTVENVLWAFTSFHAHNWHPLTWLSLQCDQQFLGGTAAAFHRTNLALHLLNMLLLFLALEMMTGCWGRSAFVAALFGVHPLHVESVAWVSERKDVLSGLFWMLTLCAYAWYVRHPSPGRYALVLVSFGLGLLAKPMLVTLPCVLLLLDLWPLRRLAIGWKRLAAEKIPLLLLSAAASIVTMQAQHRIVKGPEEFPLPIRVGNAVVSYWRYLRKTVWPSDLAIFYPHPGPLLSPLAAAIGALGLVAATVLAVRACHTRPYVTVGWLWYLGVLVPVIGLVQVGNQALADRYTYIPLIGLFVILAWGMVDFARRRGWPAALPASLGAAGIAACAVLTRVQLSYWQDGVKLWQHTVEVTAPHAISHFYLGDALQAAARDAEALPEYRQALGLAPHYPDAHRRMGEILESEGKLDEAYAEYLAELGQNPFSATAHVGLGRLDERAARLRRAYRHYEAALSLEDDRATRQSMDRVLGKLRARR